MARRRSGDESSRDELSRLLIELRGDRSQDAVAELGGITQQRVTRAERGTFPLSPDVARAYVLAIGATEAQADLVRDLAKAKVDARPRGRLALVRDAVAIQERIGRLEEDATLIRGWEPAAITGSLQTTAYTRALLAGEDDGQDPGPGWWAARRRNVDRVLEPSRTWRLLVSEAALRWTLGSRQVTADELDHLIELSRLPHVELGVVDLDSPKPFYAPRGFYLYDDHTASAATDVGLTFPDDPDDVAYYVGLFAKLEMAAAFGDDARALISRGRRRR